MSFFAELKRRNVFRVGIAYVVSAWVLLQFVDLVLENIPAPDWIMQVFMLALVICFPVALILAWAFELTPDGVKLEKDVDRSQSITKQTGQRMNRNIIIALVIAIVLLLIDKFSGDSEQAVTQAPGPQTSQAGIDPATATLEKSIAVLPFVDMSPEGDQAYFADGISEEILNVLVKTQSLKVAGRTSSFQFRDNQTDLQSIGEQLGVEHILEGSIRKANNRIRITAQLITASDGFHLWSETYDRELTDIFKIQDEIARAITEALAAELNIEEGRPSAVKVSTTNMDAYDRYLEAIGLIARRLDFSHSIELLNEATRLDPTFAAGWAANAQAHSLVYYYDSSQSKTEVLDLAEMMANKALSLDPALSMAHSVLGDIHRDRYQWSEARKNYLRALSLNPNNIEANEQFAQMLWRVNQFEEALRYSTIATELDPLSWLNLTVHAALRYVTGDRQGGWQDIQRVMKIGGGNRYFPLRHAINIAISDGKIEKANEFMIALANTNQDHSYGTRGKAELNEFVLLSHSREATLEFLANNSDQFGNQGINSTWATNLFWAAYYGDYELAESIFETGISSNNGSLLFDMTWFNYPIINPLQNTPAYRNLIRSINVDKFWRETSFPANCRPIGESDFSCH